MTNNVIPIGETETCLTCKREISVEFIFRNEDEDPTCLSCGRGNNNIDEFDAKLELPENIYMIDQDGVEY